MDQEQYDRMRLVSALMKIGHGDLSLFVVAGLPAVKHDPRLYAHFIAWNHKRSEVRDSKVAFPVVALRGPYIEDLADNAIAHLCSLGARELYRAVLFNKEMIRNDSPVTPGYGKWMKRAVPLYLRAMERQYHRWERAAVRNRKAMVGLYTISHTKPADFAQRILFDKVYPEKSIFAAIKRLPTLDPLTAAGTILTFNIPFPIAVGACPAIKDKTVLLALLEGATGTELIANTRMLQRLGVFADPVLKLAYDEAVKRLGSDKRVGTLRASQAAEHLGGEARQQMLQVAERQIDKKGKLSGRWLVLADKSGSMSRAIKLAREIASFIARVAECDLVFFDSSAFSVDVSGMTLAEITRKTSGVYATGSTSIGVGLHVKRDTVYSGIVIVSDGGENRAPYLAQEYRSYEDRHGFAPGLYLFRIPGGDRDVITGTIPGMTTWVFGEDVDHVSLPNVVATLRGSTFELLDEIFSTDLLSLSEVL